MSSSPTPVCIKILEELRMKKLTSLLLALAMMLSLVACGGSDAPAEDAADDVAVEETADPAAETYSVGICQLVQHVALDDATQGFIDALNAALPGQVEINTQNASNEIPMCSTIVNQFIAEEVDLIMANATPALQAASAATGEIPILGTSVTEYGVALGIENFSGTVGGNVSGTSDLAPLDAQAVMVQEWFPDAETIALLYCSAEANSQYQVDVMKTELEALGYTCEYYSFSDSNDLAAVVEAAAAACDIIYVPTDNTVAANTEIIDNICRPAGKPVIGGDQGICEGCTVATLCIAYYDLGYATGEMAAQVLTGEADISTMPIAYADASSVYNVAICEELGLTPPSDAYAPINDV